MLQSVASAPAWLEVIRSPAVVLAAVALLVRWVVAPAISTYTRHELQTELKQLSTFPLFMDRVERVEAAMEKLSVIPEQLARIESQLEGIRDERVRKA